MKKLIYENHKGETLDLLNWPYMWQGENVFDYGWQYESMSNGKKGGIISGFYKDITEMDCQLVICSKTEKEFKDAMNNFYKTVEKDVRATTPGRLITDDDQYMICYFIQSEKTYWRKGIKTSMNGLILVTEKPFWCKDIKYSFSENQIIEIPDYEFLDYPYNYNFDLLFSNTKGAVINDEIGDAEFEMVIYGQTENPNIAIGKNRYKMNLTLEQNEYLIINSRDKSIKRYKANGQIINEFNSRDKEKSIFAPIPAGSSQVESNAYFDLTVYQERSEPIWIL